MSLARAWSIALLGLEGRIVEVEADIGGCRGPCWLASPMPLYQARDRCKAAVANRAAGRDLL
jgi:magnesium chelatase family protein